MNLRLDGKDFVPITGKKKQRLLHVLEISFRSLVQFVVFDLPWNSLAVYFSSSRVSR